MYTARMTGALRNSDFRIQARELALKLLYMLDLSGELGDVSESAAPESEQQVRELLELEHAGRDVETLSREILQGVRHELAALDKAVQDAAVNWQISRMPVVDRAILRMGAFELLHMHDVPPRVTINEAVELAKKYSTEKSGAFVNGVLDKVFQTHCPQKS